MESSLKSCLWQQFGAAIDTLASAVNACPDDLWAARLWVTPDEPSGFSECWYIVYHTLFWLDYYLSVLDDDFAPPPPFTLDELDPAGLLPERPYTRTEMLAYLAHDRRKCQLTIESLTAESAGHLSRYGWGEVSFLELLLYNMRHVQDHAAHLNLFLGQHNVPIKSWVPRAQSS